MTASEKGAGCDGRGLWPASANRLSPLSLAGQFLRYLLCAGLAALVNFLAGSLFVDKFGFTRPGSFRPPSPPLTRSACWSISC